MGTNTTVNHRFTVFAGLLIALLGALLLVTAGCAGSSGSTDCQADTDCPYPQACLDGTCIAQLP